MINLFLKNFAFFLGSFFLSLNAHDPELFSYSNLHWMVASLCFLTIAFVVFGMKEVIVAKKDSDIYEKEQQNLVERPSLKMVIKSSCKALYQEPELLLGMVGSICQGLIGRIGMAVTSLAAQYSFQQNCES